MPSIAVRASRWTMSVMPPQSAAVVIASARRSRPEAPSTAAVATATPKARSHEVASMNRLPITATITTGTSRPIRYAAASPTPRMRQPTMTMALSTSSTARPGEVTSRPPVRKRRTASRASTAKNTASSTRPEASQPGRTSSCGSSGRATRLSANPPNARPMSCHAMVE